MARPGHRMVDVELVSAPAQDGPDAEPSASAGTATARGGRHRGRLAAAAVLLAVAVPGAWSLRTEADAVRRDDALVAAYADLPGIAPSLREPLTERWRAAVPGTIVGGLVLAREDTGGGPRTVARDAATGRARWSAPESVDPAGRGTHCAATAMGGTLLLCDVPGDPGQGGPNTDAVLGGTPDRLVVLRAADGQVVSERSLGPTAIGWTVLDDDVVVADREGATAYVERSTILGPQSRWRTQIPLPLDVLARELHVTADDGYVVLTGPVAAVLDGRSGEPLGRWESSRGGRLPVQVVTSPIGFAVWTAPQAGIWFDRTGAAGAHLPGAPIVAAVDDGSVPRVVLLQDSRMLRAVDVYAGLLWERPRVNRAAVRLDGLVLLEDGGGLRAVELATGDERWSVEPAVASLAGTPVVTDGVRFLVAGQESAGRVITAYDLRDGARRWSAPFPGDVTEVSIGTGLLVRLDGDLAVFGGAGLGS